MPRPLLWTVACLYAVCLAVAALFALRSASVPPEGALQGPPEIPHVRSSHSPKNPDDAQARLSFEQLRLQDPRTGQVPPLMRSREVAFAERLAAQTAGKTATAYTAPWRPRGPFNVGGRTRALLVLDDGPTPTLLAGGVSGGVFRSTDLGASWMLTTALADLASVTCLAADPSDTDVVYYGTGEAVGNSASRGAFFLGEGIFKSTDGGRSWQQLPSTAQGAQTVFDQFFDVVWNLAVDDAGTVYAATFGGILRSRNGGTSWTQVLGRDITNAPHSLFTDIALGPDGRLFATLSRNGTGLTPYGVFTSADGGDTWADVTPPALTADPHRMVLAPAPSDPNALYVFVQATPSGATAADHQLFRLDLTTTTWTDRSAALPTGDGDDLFGVDTQTGYNVTLEVHPASADTLWLGATNLFRSTDGGASFTLVGGYDPAPSRFIVPEHHPDQHAVAFFPGRPDTLFSAHDGGLSVTYAATNGSRWTSLNNGYLTTQFYSLAIPRRAGSSTILGGMQDNGSWMSNGTAFDDPWREVLTGDGGFAAFTNSTDVFYTSAQLGQVFRVRENGAVTTYTEVTPEDASGSLFIAPFELDPNDTDVMYLAAGPTVWRNGDLTRVPEGSRGPTAAGWQPLDRMAQSGQVVTALGVSTRPGGRVYAGTSNFSSRTRLLRLDDAARNPRPLDITPSGVTPGAYPSSIAVNPDDANEVVVTFSNYNVPSVFHTQDGGRTWTDVEGSLAGADGPSVRWAQVVPTGFGTTYYLATSTGLYATETLQGVSTTWMPEAPGVVGNVVVDMIRARPDDGFVAIASHGRGVYSTSLDVTDRPQPAAVLLTPSVDLDVPLEGTATAEVRLRNTGVAPLSYSARTTGALPLTVTPLDGRIEPGATLDFDLTFDAAGLDAGAYVDTLILATNAGTFTMPITAEVVPAVAALSVEAVDLTLFANETDSTTFEVRNDGAVPLTYALSLRDAAQNEVPGFMLRPASGTVAPGTAQPVTLVFDASTRSGPGTLTATLRLTGNGGRIDVPVSVTVRPSLVVQETLAIEGRSGERTTAALTLANESTAPLDYVAMPRDVTAGRLLVSAPSGTIPATGSQELTVTYDAADVATGTYTATLFITSSGGSASVPVTIEVLSGVGAEDAELPQTLWLGRNYPNPFNPQTTIRYGLPQAAHVTLAVYDLAGRRVATLFDGPRPAGEHAAVWDGRTAAGTPAPSGAYLYRLTTSAAGRTDRQLTGTMVLVK